MVNGKNFIITEEIEKYRKERDDFMEKIKFYSPSDLTTGFWLDKITNYMEQDNTNELKLNDALEKYNISCYGKHDLCLCSWDAEFILKFKETCLQYERDALRYFNTVTESTLWVEIETLDFDYLEDFWTLFDNTKLYKRVSPDCFQQILAKQSSSLLEILKYKKIVKTYDQIIKKEILQLENADIILKSYKNSEIILPDSLTSSEIEDRLNFFINQDTLNINELRRIFYMRDYEKFKISDKTKLKVKKSCETKEEDLFKSKNVASFGFELKLVKSDVNDSFTSECYKEDNVDIFSFSEKWLKETLEFPSIFNNFVHIFNFSTIQMTISGLAQKNHHSLFEQLITLSNSGERYGESLTFQYMQNYLASSMFFYYSFLKNNDINLEDGIKWFFSEYITTEFSTDEIKIQLPSPDSSYLEKCRTIVDIIESVSKQYSYWVDYGEIDYELIGFSSKQTTFESLPSLLKHKYVYGKGEDFTNVSFLLFSDRSPLNYSGSSKETIDFFQKVKSKKANTKDFNQLQNTKISHLVDKKLLIITEDGIISEKTPFLFPIVEVLHTNGFLSRQFYPKDFNNAFELLFSENLITYGSSLLSKQECQYFNFYLNAKEFADGLDLRNKYSHGGQQVIENENEHFTNYLTLLRLLVLLIIKINDDLCLADKFKANSDSKINCEGD